MVLRFVRLLYVNSWETSTTPQLNANGFKMATTSTQPRVVDLSIPISPCEGTEKLAELFGWRMVAVDAIEPEMGDGFSLEEIRFLQTQQSVEKIDERQLLAYQDSLEEFGAVLSPLELFLTNFNGELAAMSSELESLKVQALSLSSNLDRKRELEQRYSPLVGDLAIPPEVVKEVFNGEVNGNWCELLLVLEDKRLLYDKYKDDKLGSMEQLSKLLDALNVRALERIKQFMITQIKQLRIVGTPSQVVQSRMLNAKEAFLFLQKREPSLALELRQAYVYTMRWYYREHFHRYTMSLEKLRIPPMDKSILIGGSQSYFHTQQNEYTVGKRANMITAEDPTVMPAQIAEHNPTTQYIETGYRSFNLALCDNASVEYLFIVEFFGGDANALLEQIFDPTYKLGSSYTKALITSTYDIFGVLILIRLSQSLIYELQKRRIPMVEDYFNLQMILLWPRFQQLVDANCENMKRAAVKSSSISSITVSKPHPLTVQFANLIYGFQQLTARPGTQEPLSQSMSRLCHDYESVMTKLGKNTKQSELFLYKQYGHVLSIVGGEERAHFEKLVAAFEP